MLPVTLNLRCMNMVTLWTSKDSENKDTFDITSAQSINGPVQRARFFAIR